LIYGSQDFVADLKDRFLNNRKNVELPQHKSLFREFSPELLIEEASKILGFNLWGKRGHPLDYWFIMNYTSNTKNKCHEKPE